MHLGDIFLNFGPAHSFWYFSYECYNGLLGSFTTNRKAIEVQVMRKFCIAQSVRCFSSKMICSQLWNLLHLILSLKSLLSFPKRIQAQKWNTLNMYLRLWDRNKHIHKLIFWSICNCLFQSGWRFRCYFLPTCPKNCQQMCFMHYEGRNKQHWKDTVHCSSNF